MESEPVSLTKEATEGSRIVVKFEDGTSDEYDTVLFATGRTPSTANLGLPSEAFASPTSAKLIVDEKNLVRGRMTLYTCLVIFYHLEVHPVFTLLVMFSRENLS